MLLTIFRWRKLIIHWILLPFLEEGQISSSNYSSSDSSSIFLWTQEVREMLLPGKIIHIFEYQQQVSMCFREPKDLNQIVVSAEMINDHMPASYQRIISRAKQRFTHQNNAHQDLNPFVWTMPSKFTVLSNTICLLQAYSNLKKYFSFVTIRFVNFTICNHL